MAHVRAGAAPRASSGLAWLVVAGGIAAALHAGKLPAALPVLQSGLGMSLQQGVWLLSLFQLALLVGGLALSLVAGSVGLRRAMASGLALLAAGSLAGSLAATPAALMLARCIESLGLLAVAVSGPALVRQLAGPSRQHLMLAAWGTFMPAGFAIGLLLAPWLLAQSGWPALWRWCALPTALCALLLVRCLPHTSAGRRPTGTQARALARRVLATPRTTGLGLVFALYAGLWLTLVGLLPVLLVREGLTLSLSALLGAGVVAVNATGNLAAGWLAGRGWSARARIALGFGVLLAGLPFALLAHGHGEAWRVAAALVASALGGLVPGTLFQLLPRVAPGPDAVPATTGWMLQWSAAGQIALPPLLAGLLPG